MYFFVDVAVGFRGWGCDEEICRYAVYVGWLFGMRWCKVGKWQVGWEKFRIGRGRMWGVGAMEMCWMYILVRQIVENRRRLVGIVIHVG